VLQALEGLRPLTISRRHINVENSDKTVRRVFDASSLALRSPRHSAGDGVIARGRSMAQQILGDAGNALEKTAQICLSPSVPPDTVVEDHISRCNKLLQCPSTGEPAATSKRRCKLSPGVQVRQVDVADLCLLVPVEHGVDGLGKLGAAGLVDATCINPSELETMLGREGEGLLDFAMSFPELDCGSPRCWKVTSSSSHAWERIA